MTLTPAPFHSESAQAPADAHAIYAEASDGARLRLGHLGRGPRGTVMLIPGRTEYLEKYGLAAGEFAARGYGTAAIDYRGQGLAERLLSDRRIGHVHDFADYQRDVDALAAFMEREAMPRPWFLLGHSLGGAIGLRAIARGVPVRAAVFSAPMWGIRMAPPLRPVAWGLGWLADKTGINHWITPGTGAQTYVVTADPTDNFLTTDPEMLAYMRRHLDAQPDLGLGGPSVPWLYRAMRECRALGSIADPGLPTLTVLPSHEEIVSLDAMRLLVEKWPKAEVLDVPGGRHETMMETAERRKLFFDSCEDFFERSCGPETGSASDLAEGVA